jgi:hypothetical protein
MLNCALNYWAERNEGIRPFRANLTRVLRSGKIGGFQQSCLA